MKVAVTGGAGFIGSHLADALIASGHEVLVIDDLSRGDRSNLNPAAAFLGRDIRSDLSRELEGVESLFHLAADSDVRRSAGDPSLSFEANVLGTFSLLESCRKAGVRRFVLASTSTVYGDASLIPTPETHPCMPISNYGASKLSCEGYLSSYSATYGLRGTALRLANIYGERSRHGVMHDLFMKLKADPRRLEILGDGKQDKSYLYISDCVSAILRAWERRGRSYEVFNAGGEGKITVDALSLIISRRMGLDPELVHAPQPGQPAGGGWAGDVTVMLPDTSKLRGLGWKPEVGLEEGIGRYVSWLERIGAERR